MLDFYNNEYSRFCISSYSIKSNVKIHNFSVQQYNVKPSMPHLQVTADCYLLMGGWGGAQQGTGQTHTHNRTSILHQLHHFPDQLNLILFLLQLMLQTSQRIIDTSNNSTYPTLCTPVCSHLKAFNTIFLSIYSFIPCTPRHLRSTP